MTNSENEKPQEIDEAGYMQLEIKRKFLWPFRVVMLIFAWHFFIPVLQALNHGEIVNKFGRLVLAEESPIGFLITVAYTALFFLIPFWFGTFGVKAKEDKSSGATNNDSKDAT